MLTLILKNPKSVIMFFTALAVPMVMSSLGFIMTTSQTNAKTPMLETRIERLEKNSYSISAQYKMIHDSLILIQNREYEELKHARQERLKNKE